MHLLHQDAGFFRLLPRRRIWGKPNLKGAKEARATGRLDQPAPAPAQTLFSHSKVSRFSCKWSIISGLFLSPILIWGMRGESLAQSAPRQLCFSLGGGHTIRNPALKTLGTSAPCRWESWSSRVGTGAQDVSQMSVKHR